MVIIIMVYHDHLMKTNCAEEDVCRILEIFLLFRAVNILQSDNVREFYNKILESLRYGAKNWARKVEAQPKLSTLP